MTIIATFIAVILAVMVSYFLGPLGGLILISLIFGLTLSTYMRNREIQNDIQRIKEKLGIIDKDDFNLTDDEIEEVFENEQEIHEGKRGLSECDKEIEMELEEYLKTENEKKEEK
jgi:uncharacterized membrane protein YgaE (UPF0421/DUF939 family)